MRMAALAALFTVALSVPAMADTMAADSSQAPKPAMTVVDGSDASVPVGSSVSDGIDTDNAGSLNDLPTIATHAPTPLIPVSVLK
jgi:hypothetical protein